MLFNQAIINIGIVVIGAVVVLVTAFLIFRANPKKAPEQTQQPTPENTGGRDALNDESTAQRRETGDRKDSAIWKIRRYILKQIRELRKHSSPPDRQPVDGGLALKEQPPETPPDDVGPEFQTTLPPSNENSEVSNAEPASNEGIDVNIMSASPVDPEQTPPNIETVNEEENEVEMPDNFTNGTPEPAEEQAQEEIEQLIVETEKEGITPDSDRPEQTKTGDDMFDLFKDEIVEESDTSKFAANLHNVDIHDLLKEARNLRNNLGGMD